jgi:hypothetical protein
MPTQTWHRILALPPHWELVVIAEGWRIRWWTDLTSEQVKESFHIPVCEWHHWGRVLNYGSLDRLMIEFDAVACLFTHCFLVSWREKVALEVMPDRSWQIWVGYWVRSWVVNLLYMTKSVLTWLSQPAPVLYLVLRFFLFFFLLDWREGVLLYGAFQIRWGGKR